MTLSGLWEDNEYFMMRTDHSRFLCVDTRFLYDIGSKRCQRMEILEFDHV